MDVICGRKKANHKNGIKDDRAPMSLQTGHVTLALGVWLSICTEVPLQRRAQKSDEILKCMQSHATNVIWLQATLNCSNALQGLQNNISMECIYQWSNGDCLSDAEANERKAHREQVQHEVECALALSMKECKGRIQTHKGKKRKPQGTKEQRKKRQRGTNRNRTEWSFLECWCFFVSHEV